MIWWLGLIIFIVRLVAERIAESNAAEQVKQQQK